MAFDVFVTVLAGVGIGLSLAAPPGPVNAVIASHTVTRSWRAGFLVGVGATTADTIFLAITILARSVVAGIEPYVPFIALLGAGVMVYFAWSTAKVWKRADAIVGSTPEEHAKSYATGLSVNLTSPYPILWWLTAGLVLIRQLGPAVLVGFFAGLLLGSARSPSLCGRRSGASRRPTGRSSSFRSPACSPSPPGSSGPRWPPSRDRTATDRGVSSQRCCSRSPIICSNCSRVISPRAYRLRKIACASSPYRQ